MGPTNTQTKFWPGPASRTLAHRPQSFGLTVLEAEISRSAKEVDMGICELLMTSWFQKGQNCQNRTIKLLLHKHLQFSELIEIMMELLIKIRQFWSDFDIFGLFVIRKS